MGPQRLLRTKQAIEGRCGNGAKSEVLTRKSQVPIPEASERSKRSTAKGSPAAGAPVSPDRIHFQSWKNFIALQPEELLSGIDLVLISANQQVTTGSLAEKSTPPSNEDKRIFF